MTWIKITLVFGIVGVACLLAAYLQVGHHWWAEPGASGCRRLDVPGAAGEE